MNFSGISGTTLLGRILRGPLRLIPAAAVVPILQGPMRGRKWVVGSGTHGCWMGSFEHDKQRAFAQTVAAGGVVYDLGANVGFYTLLASVLVGNAGCVYCFEPLPRNTAYLRKHVALNRLQNCVVFEAAAGNADGEARFEDWADPTMGRLSERGKIVVRSVRLDSLVSEGEIRPPNVMKIDIEGGELDALKGCVQTIEKYRPTIVLATHGPDVHRSCVQFLRERSYRLESLTTEPVDSTEELIARPE
jgi:FkbM family methyltransferase